MKDRRKNRKKRRILFVLYVSVCLAVIIAAYFHLSRIAQNFNTQHLELITGMYAEKMNESMDYLKNQAEEETEIISAMQDKNPEEILKYMEGQLDQNLFCNIGLILNDGKICGNASTASDIKKQNLDQRALESRLSFISDPYQSSQNGTMVMTIVVPVEDHAQIHSVYVSVMIDSLRKLGDYDVLRGKVSVHLLKADSENFITCIGNEVNETGNWNNLLLQQRYYKYDGSYSYDQWIRDMRSGKTEGCFSAKVRGEDSTIFYRSISGMPGWYVIAELVNKDVSNITQYFSVWGGIYGSILVGFTILYMLTILILEKKDKERYMGLSNTDPLTELLNRRALQRAVEEEIYKKTQGYFIFIDVDNFKKYNDTYGHDVGDLCLKHLAQAMKKCFPKESIIGRYGGDEFVVFIKEWSAEKVKAYMEKFQNIIGIFTLPDGKKVNVSVSAGGARCSKKDEDFVSLCRRADAELYHVKQNGKAAFKVKEE